MPNNFIKNTGSRFVFDSDIQFEIGPYIKSLKFYPFYTEEKQMTIFESYHIQYHNFIYENEPVWFSIYTNLGLLSFLRLSEFQRVLVSKRGISIII